jgi:hypothetical protein
MAAQHDISLPEAFNLMVDDDTAIREGVKAADRLVRGQSLTDQLLVARALMVGRRAALAETGANRPEGKPYNAAFNKWLGLHPRLAAVHGPVRAAALWCIEEANWPKVQAALKALDDRSRQRATLRGLRTQIERPAAAAPSPRPYSRKPTPDHEPAPAAAGRAADEGLRTAEVRALKAEIEALRREHANEIKALKEAHVRDRMAEFVRGEQNGAKHAAAIAAQDIAKLKTAAHEAVVAKLAEKFAASGQTKPTEQDVFMAATGRRPKVERSKVPVFSEREIALLRKALHPDGKPAGLQKMFTEASVLFNERAPLLVKQAKGVNRP